ncbi:MAG: TIM-barrel domain-containing protein [Rikenellaceae bacterium]
MYRLIIYLASVVILTSCGSNYDLTQNTVKDIDGIISFAATSYDDANNWQVYRYYTGEGVRQQEDNDGESTLEYTISIDEAQDYRLYVLATTMQSKAQQGEFGVTANERSNSEYESSDASIDQHVINFEIANSVGDFELVESVPFNLDINPQSWLSGSTMSPNQVATISFGSKGIYRLRISLPIEAKAYIDRVILSAGDYIPSGTGVEDTSFDKDEIFIEGLDPLVVLPPHWAFGVVYGGYTDQAQTESLVDKLVEADYPIDAYWIDSWFWNYENKGKGPAGYMSFVEDKAAFPNIKQMWDHFSRHSIKGGIWVWDCIMREGNEVMYDDFNSRKLFANRFIETNRWHNSTGQTICGNIDFENPDAVAYWQEQLKPFFDKGLDFLKLDRSSEIPFCKAAFEATQNLGKETSGRGFIMAHLHTTFDKRHKSYPTKWSGDAKITWSQPNYPNLGVYAMGGYKENIEMIADPKRSTYEIPFLTHDAGGYDFFQCDDASEELYTRWIQFSSLNTLMTIFSQHYNPTKNHPYNYSLATQKIIRKYLKLRMQLFPYIYTYALNTRLCGRKMIQGDGVNEQQYLFGNELLVAPIYTEGATTRTLYLPQGAWYDFESGERYQGDQTITVDAPINKIPLFAREGAIIPMRDYARSIEQGSNKRITLKIYPSTIESSFSLLEDDGVSNDYLDGGFSSTNISAIRSENQIKISIAPLQGDYKGVVEKRQWAFEIYSHALPELVVVDGKEIDNYSYDKESSILSLTLAEKSTDKEVDMVLIF